MTILVIFALALIVLGPEKLPCVVSEAGCWVGRARGTARQFREQLEEEGRRSAQAPSRWRLGQFTAGRERPPPSAEPASG